MQKLGQGINSWQWAKQAPGFKGKIFVSSGLPTEGTLMFASAAPHCWSLSRTKQSIVSSCPPLTRSFTANRLSSKIACRKGSNIRITYNCASDVRDTRKQIRSLPEFVSIWITAITTGLRLGRSEVLQLSLRHYLPAQSQASITSTAWRREASKKKAIDDLL